MSTEELEDVFNDQPAVSGEGDSKTFDLPAKEQEQPVVDSAASEAPEQEAQDDQQSGEQSATEPPSAAQENDKSSKPEKMIPESRFKAALKDATDRLNNATAELAKLKATPAPDRDSDPEGYERHVRLEVSRDMMRQSKPDYEEVIQHYVEMAKVNPHLNDQVASHAMPAMFAYDLAKEDMRISELREIASSEDYKEFLEWKSAKAKNADVAPAETNKVVKQLSDGAPRVPNLNRATSVSRTSTKTMSDDEELFAGAL